MDCRDRILSNQYYDVITNFPVELLENTGLDFCHINVDDLYNIVYVNQGDIRNVTDYVFDYKAVPKLYGLMQTGGAGRSFDPNSLIASGITQAQRPPLSLSGRGVVICIIDTGIDYTDMAFRDSEGNSRILAIWDQTDQSGRPPEGLFYGTEYTREDIDRALGAQDPYSVVPSRDENGHGSVMAGVAAGSRLGSGMGYLGAAPDADIIVVKLKQAKQFLRDFYIVPPGVPAYEETDIMLGVLYADRFARQFERPVVICLGLGTNYGDHAGSSPLPGYLNAVANRRSRAVVVCGGNEGDKEHHYEHTVPDTVEIRVPENTKGFCMELWGTLPDIYTVRLRSPGGETSPEIDFRSREDRVIDFIFESTVVTVSNLIVERDAGEQLVFFRFEDPTPGIWNLQVYLMEGQKGTGTFHIWLPITEFMEQNVTFLAPSPGVTLTEPSNAERIITISAYNGLTGSWFTESGRGFTKSGVIKPDLAAPGVQVPTVLGPVTGSSMSAALAAGCVAQFMEWAVVEGNTPTVESRGIKSFLIRGADRSENIVYPDNRWGFGKIDINGTFETLARL